MFPEITAAKISWRAYLLALGGCLLTTLAALPLRHLLDLANMVMLFLLTVFLVTLKLGRGPGVLSAVVSVVLFDYVFVPPHLELIPSDAQYLVTLAVMLAVALMTAQLTAGLQTQTRIASSREQQTRRLYQLARDLAGAASRWEVQTALDGYLGDSGYRAVLHLLDEGVAPQHSTADAELGDFVQDVIRRAKTLECPKCNHALFVPLLAPSRVNGVMVVTRSDDKARTPHEEQELFETVASLIAIAIERLHYVEVAEETHLQASAERLRASILSALSHDMRTPLTALVAMADSLTLTGRVAVASTTETATAIRNQALAMDQMLGNLLEMARLQSGKAVLRKEWQLFDDLIASSLRQLKNTRGSHPVRVHLAPDMPLVKFDAVLMERVVVNLLENAFKYTLPDTPIDISAAMEGEWALLTVCDRGPGFPSGRTEDLFELFVRGTPESSKTGMGLGLAICRTIVEAHGGTIQAHNRPEGGACVQIRLPLGIPPALDHEEMMS